MKITTEQLIIIDALTNLFIKVILALSSIAGFWVILYHIVTNITSINPINTAILAALDLMLSGTLYYIIAHYFPAFKALSKEA